MGIYYILQTPTHHPYKGHPHLRALLAGWNIYRETDPKEWAFKSPWAAANKATSLHLKGMWRIMKVDDKSDTYSLVGVYGVATPAPIRNGRLTFLPPKQRQIR